METILLANEINNEEKLTAESQRQLIDAVRELNALELSLVGGGQGVALYL